jgi:hypothetical protein
MKNAALAARPLRPLREKAHVPKFSKQRIAAKKHAEGRSVSIKRRTRCETFAVVA